MSNGRLTEQDLAPHLTQKINNTVAQAQDLETRSEELSTQLADTGKKTESFIGSSAFVDMQTAINTAINTKTKLKIPKGTYNFSQGLIIDGRLDLEGSINDVTFDFTAMASGVAITIGNLNQLNGVTISGLKLKGKPTLTALRLNASGEIGKPITDSAFRDLRIENFGIGLKGIYSWCLLFDNVRFQNCVQPLEIGSQFNNTEFNRVSLVSSSSPSTFTNCEGINFTSPNIANVTGDAFTIYQSQVSIINPYYEYISGYMAKIGGSNEVKKSAFTSIGGISTDPIVKVALNGHRCQLMLKNLGKDAKFVVENVPSDTVMVNKYSHFIEVDSYEPKLDEFLVKWDGTNGLTPFEQSSSSLKFRADVQPNGYANLTNTATSSAGIKIATNLVVGENYTLVYAIRTPVDKNATLFVPNLTSIQLATNTVAEDFEVRYLPFMAKNTTLRLQWSGETTIQASFIGVIKGSKFPKIPFTKGELMDTKVPTTGTWGQGTKIFNSLPNAGGYEGWVCTGGGTPGTWKGFGSIEA